MTMITNANFLGKKVNFIRNIRETFGIGLKEAKEIADRFPRYHAEEYFVDYYKIYDPLAFNLIRADSCDFPKEDSNQQPENKTLKAKVKELAKEAIDLDEYSLAQSLIDILK